MVEDIILANSDRKELGAIQDSNITVDVNGEYEFSVQIARSNWYADLDLASYVYITGTEYGGIVGEVLTDTTLDYVELKGLTWRGRLQYKVIEPPSGSDYKTVSGELNQVMKTLIEPEFDGLFKVSTANTGVSVKNYQFDRYCTLLGGLTKMLKSVGYRLQIRLVKEQGNPCYILIEAVKITDYSSRIELSQDSQLNFTMDDKRNGVNHLIVTGKGELQERNVIHLYVQIDGSIGKTQYYKGLDEISAVYENTSTETAELEKSATEKLQDLMNKMTFQMDVAKLGIKVEINGLTIADVKRLFTVRRSAAEFDTEVDGVKSTLSIRETIFINVTAQGADSDAYKTATLDLSQLKAGITYAFALNVVSAVNGEQYSQEVSCKLNEVDMGCNGNYYKLSSTFFGKCQNSDKLYVSAFKNGGSWTGVTIRGIFIPVD